MYGVAVTSGGGAGVLAGVAVLVEGRGVFCLDGVLRRPFWEIGSWWLRWDAWGAGPALCSGEAGGADDAREPAGGGVCPREDGRDGAKSSFVCLVLLAGAAAGITRGGSAGRFFDRASDIPARSRSDMAKILEVIEAFTGETFV